MHHPGLRKSAVVELRILVIEFLRLVVEGHSLCPSVDNTESSDPELFACFHNSSHPSAFERLSLLEHLFGHHLAPLIEHQVSLGEASLSPGGGTIPHLALRAGLHLLGHFFRLLDLGASNSSLSGSRFRGLGGLRFGTSAGLSGSSSGGAL